MMHVVSPIGQLVNMSHTSFVDDVCTTAVTSECKQLSAMAKKLTNSLNSAFDQCGFIQNEAKAMAVAKAYGRHAH